MTSTSRTYHGISPPSPLPSWDANSSAWYLLNFLQQNFMSQMYVSTPTRFNNILDLVISDSDRLIHHTEVQQTNQSDHDLVRVTLPFNPKATPKPEIPLFDPDSFRCFDIHQADYDRINLYLHSPEHRLGCSKEQLPLLTSLICSTERPSKPVLSSPQSKLSPLLPSPSLPDSAEPSHVKRGSLTHVSTLSSPTTCTLHHLPSRS